MLNAADTEAMCAASRRWSNIVVLVAHGTPLVSAGLVSTLRRLPFCEVRLWNVAAHRRAGIPGNMVVHVVLGDVALLTEFSADRERLPGGSSAGLRPKLVLVTVGEDLPDRSCAVRNVVDGCLSIACAEEDLFETVRRLGGNEVAVPIATQPLRRRFRNPARGGLAPGALRRVSTHIDQRLAENLELGELAAIAGLSACHFARAFKQSVGVPPHRYLMQRRVEVAADLIRDTDRALADISLASGFADQSHFTRMFASVTGETPGAFRRRHR